MTPRERMIVAMKNGQADCVPVAPDMSNMIPCRLTGKPFWDIYLYNDPPLWEAYIAAAKHFGFDGWLAGVPMQVDFEREEAAAGRAWQEAIVVRTPDRIYTRSHAKVDGKEQWSKTCNVYYIDNPPTHNLPLAKVNLPDSDPTEWEDVHRRRRYEGLEALNAALDLMGESGVVGVGVSTPQLSLQPESIYEYFDDKDKVLARCEDLRKRYVRRMNEIVKLKRRPDFILTGGSGMMLANPEPIFRELCLPTLKDVTRICKEAGIPSQIHCCGPEATLVKITAQETDLSSINPLEIPPMGDCDLAELKKSFGRKIGLMGNLHTTNVMLKGTPKDVELASRKAMDDAAEGGGFILSTGDQCGRDTPDANIHAMIETARKYGKY